VLPTITVPTLLIVGEGDITTPPELSRYLHENISGSRLEIVPNARHIVNMEKPAIVNKLIIDFLQQN
jgi:non-heme chloroperoxidase